MPIPDPLTDLRALAEGRDDPIPDDLVPAQEGP